jgi:hypothetical protein
MKTIYKYPLAVTACTIDLPVGSKVICVHEQNGVPTLWVEQNPSLETDAFTFAVIGTGRPVPEDGEHIGTCFIGQNVWHVYKKINS